MKITPEQREKLHIAYDRAETWFDALAATFVASKWTLAIAVGLLAVVFVAGVVVGRP